MMHDTRVTMPPADMRRFARHILNALSGLSLLLCVVTGVLWARSYFVFESLIHTQEPFVSTKILSSRGHIIVGEIAIDSNFAERGWDYERHAAGRFDLLEILLDSASLRPDHDLRLAVFRWVSGEFVDLRSFHISILIIPHATVVGLFAIFPVIWLSRAICSRRSPPTATGSYCRRCGYDLRATGNRCPECGTIPLTK